MAESETTPVLTRLDARAMAALDAWIGEQREAGVELGRGDAIRALAKDCLIGAGLLGVR
jgi:hypothetical protein